MAGSYNHIVDDKGNFKGIETIGNLGDAYEALEECYYLIKILSGGSERKIKKAKVKMYKTYLK